MDWRSQNETPFNDSVIEVRSKIHALLDFFVEEGLATESTVDEYRAGAEADETLEGLVGFHHWIVEKRFMAIRAVKEIENEIELAMADEILSEDDRDELMSQLVLTDQVDFVGQAAAIQEAVHEELEAMRADREAFEALSENELIEDGVLAIGDGAEIEIPDAKGFLEMSIEERRAFLEKVSQLLPKAEGHKEHVERMESLKLEKEFFSLLSGVRDEGVIGFRAIQRFMGHFRKLDNETKSETIEAMDDILEPYTELWEEIRETLEGRPLKRLENLLDLLDHKSLKSQFERTCDQECLKMDWEYSSKLAKAVSENVLPARVLAEWVAEMRHEGMEGKKEKLESLDEALEPYEEMRAEIDELEHAEWVREIEAMMHGGVCGLGEIQEKLEEFTESESEEEEGPDEESLKILSKVRRDRVAESILETGEELEHDQKVKLVSRLEHYLEGRMDDEYHDFDDNVVEARVEHKVAFIEHSNILAEEEEEKLFEADEILAEESDEIVLPLDTEVRHETEAVEHEDDATVIEIPEPEAEVNGEETFEEIVYLDREDDEEDTRVVKMEIADGEAVDIFTGNSRLNAKNDLLSLVTGGEENDVELDLRESRVLVDFLKHDLKKEEQSKMAA